MNNAPFQKIPDAARATGLSQSYLRRGCKAGTVPHIMSGNTYYIDVAGLLLQLRAQMNGSAANENGG